ncbi:unnamed protein product [Bemisia tabaci]|uniref:Transmembrane protein 132E n=2 Tax=Bemisia tabaci TaxID=7038 RepID=A0A9P0AFC6_BEMTA|nr:unnamed protein product [Bemisia tabaci]
MKVFTVSQAGKVADVTLQSTCHSDDESVLKVSSSCSSVYVDGTEVRGSSNASVLVKYDTYIGVAKFVVWMPEFPLDLNVADFKLSQIKGWKVPSESNPTSSMKSKRSSDETSAKSKKHSGWTNVASIGGVNVNTVVTEDIGNSIDSEKSNSPCRLRFQQSPVEVYARFLATDHNSGRVSYFVSRQTWLTVTDLVIPSLRVSDPRIATLQGKIVQGRSVGRTKVQVMSPITGRVLGSTDISVTSDKVSLTRMRVHVVSGLQLSITPDTSIDNGFIAQTSVTRKLTAQYQEGLLDIDLEFSDGMRTPLQDISLSDFSLQVESLRPEVVAFAPLVTSSHPRVIAVGPGSGQLLKTILLPAEVCQLQRSTPLATATASVQVDFVPNDRPEFVQNDGGSLSSVKERKLHKEDLNDILIGLPLKDENNHEPTVQARQHHNSFMNPRRHGNVHLSPLEIGMYVLLAAFCFAIVVFVVSCVVYASKFKPHPNDMPDHLPETIPVLGNNHTSGNGLMNMKRDHEEPTTNVHDWVWLGRATLERASGLLIPASANRLKSNINKQIRITSNPTYAAAPNPDVDLQLGTCFDNPNHVELPSQQNIAPPLQIDSKTYCKKNKKHQTSSKILPPLPPLPLEGSVEDCEYRPPVPPHRNTRSSKHRTVDSVTEQPKEKSHKSHHHHHHHHHRHRNINESCHPRHIDQLKNVKKQNSSEKQDTIAAETESSVAAAKFVEYSSPPSEVKRATIVGNPMFSLNDTASDKNKDDLIGLEDLNLGMDYQQIMEYFDNLKESNA